MSNPTTQASSASARSHALVSDRAPPAAPESAAARAARKRAFIVGPLYDTLLFTMAPLWVLAMGMWLFRVPLLNDVVRLPSLNPRFSQPFLLFVIAVFTHAHIVIVFFRSHGNERIYNLHPFRFRVAPVLLLVAMLTSQWAFLIVSVLVVWWDVYHSAMQTFGLGRIYDAKLGNPPTAGRRVDQLFNLLMYVGPIFAGASLWEHLKHFEAFSKVDAPALASIGEVVFARQPDTPLWVLGAAVPAVALYVAAYARIARQTGYRMPQQKVLLYVSTTVCSVVAWGFLSVGEAFFVMNFFHALQYFAIVWWSERKTVVRIFRLGEVPARHGVALVLLVVPALAYGVWANVKPGVGVAVVAVSHVASILHFWYDGFIWSVRKKQV